MLALNGGARKGLAAEVDRVDGRDIGSAISVEVACQDTIDVIRGRHTQRRRPHCRRRMSREESPSTTMSGILFVLKSATARALHELQPLQLVHEPGKSHRPRPETRLRLCDAQIGFTVAIVSLPQLH